MAWTRKEAECDWCQTEINAMIDGVYESEKGTLCQKCEKARLDEKVLYGVTQADPAHKMERAVSKVAEDLMREDNKEEALDKEAELVSEFCDKCGQELTDGEDGSNEALNP